MESIRRYKFRKNPRNVFESKKGVPCMTIGGDRCESLLTGYRCKIIDCGVVLADLIFYTDDEVSYEQFESFDGDAKLRREIAIMSGRNLVKDKAIELAVKKAVQKRWGKKCPRTEKETDGVTAI